MDATEFAVCSYCLQGVGYILLFNFGIGKRIRTTNAVEKSFREVRGRTRDIGRFRDEQRALRMVWWQMEELRWYGVDMTKEAGAILAGIRVSKLERIAA